MQFRLARLQNFRNIDFVELPLLANREFLLGANGQGKSNLLEALGFVTACRSFRTQNLSVLSKRGTPGFSVLFEVEHEHSGLSELEIHGGSSGRKVVVDGEPMSRLGDFIGRFPVVTLSSGDLQLLRGGPGERRRFVDITLSAIDPSYYEALRDFHRGISERNRLLKQGGSAGEFDAFERPIAERMVKICQSRGALMGRLNELTVHYYRAMADVDEGPFLEFKPNSASTTLDECRAELERNRKRDEILGSTQKGPHRDDFGLGLEVGGARDYASDGQQRGLCVALRLAQMEIYRAALSVAPVLLVDDVLGELDSKREQGFWEACPMGIQIIATGTEFPKDSATWACHKVLGGRVERLGG